MTRNTFRFGFSIVEVMLVLAAAGLVWMLFSKMVLPRYINKSPSSNQSSCSPIAYATYPPFVNQRKPTLENWHQENMRGRFDPNSLRTQVITEAELQFGLPQRLFGNSEKGTWRFLIGDHDNAPEIIKYQKPGSAIIDGGVITMTLDNAVSEKQVISKVTRLRQNGTEESWEIDYYPRVRLYQRFFLWPCAYNGKNEVVTVLQDATPTDNLSVYIGAAPAPGTAKLVECVWTNGTISTRQGKLCLDGYFTDPNGTQHNFGYQYTKQNKLVHTINKRPIAQLQ